jgi:hypothetical protein
MTVLAANLVTWAELGMTASQAVDSTRIWDIDLDVDVYGEGAQVCLAGCLAKITDHDKVRHKGVVVFWMDEVYAWGQQTSTALPTSLITLKQVFPGRMKHGRPILMGLFGRPVDLLKRWQLDEMWKGWSKPVRRGWVARRTWSLEVMTISGVVGPDLARKWSANYATNMLRERGQV